MKSINDILQILYELKYILNRKQKRSAITVLFFIIVSSIFELLGVSAILPFVQTILTPDMMMQKEYVKWLADILNIKSANQLLILIGIGIILLYVLKNVYMIFSYYIQFDYSTRIQKELSLKMLNSFMKRPYTYFLDANSSDILRGCSSDISGVYTIISSLLSFTTEMLTVILIGGYIIYTDWFTAVGALILMFSALLVIVLVFKPIIKRAGQKSLEALSMTNKAIYQAVMGIKEIFVMQRKDKFIGIYEQATDISRKVNRTYSILNNTPDRITEAVCVGGIIGIVCIRLITGDDSMNEFIPKLAVFAMAAFKIFPSVGKLAGKINSIVYYRPTLANVYDNMKAANEYEHSVQMYIEQYGSDVSDVQLLEFQSELRISHIMWQYARQAKPVLADISMTIRKGEAIGLIGPSGSGKTTLSDVILGLLKPIKGHIYMDGIDVYTMPEAWAKIVGYVPQSVFLIDDTVRSNILFGEAVDVTTDDKVWDALERAQLKEFIASLPEGLDTIVGERGIRFSGGQRQRIAIARALYNNPEILILDEATAALDNETESAVMESIDALLGKITLIIVAHRLTTIRNCDTIYEIKDGMAYVKDKQEVLEQL